MIKLNSQVKSLENVIAKIEKRIEELEEKRDNIEYTACYENRDMTKREWAKYYELDELIDDLQEEINEIQNAIDYIIDYCD